tara:strand:+ start:193 stop:2352 length:2160 start_codon:yes stop_codon:yes gene_type:complete
MAQRVTTSFVNTNIPGAYVETTVISSPVGITNTGDIVIIGEAAGGADITQESLKDNWFTPTQLDRVRAKYLSGPIVDAMSAMTAPSNDSEITGSAGRVYIVKTNVGTQASRALDASPSGTYGTLTDKNYGIDGNKYKVQVINVEDEVGASIQGTDLVIGDGSIFDGLSFGFRGNGGAETTVTLSATMGDHDTIAELAAEIDAQLPAGFSCNEATTDALIFSSDADADANGKGEGKAFELIDSTPGDLLALGHAVGLTVSSQEPEVEVSIIRQDTNTNESHIVKAEVALKLGYVGTSATVSINSGVLTTTVVGGAGANLSINLDEHATMADLATFIDSQDGYSASSEASSNNLAPIRLDEVTASGICSTGDLEAGRIKKSAYNMALKLSESSTLDFDFTLSFGLPAEMNKAKFLAGGTKGGTKAADIVNAIAPIEGVKVNFVVPLFSRDASEDIAEGLTDSSSTYTIDAINFAVKSHALAMSTVKLKKNRLAMLSKWDTYANAKTHAQTLASFRALVFSQKTTQTNSANEVVDYLPWHTACVATGMQSAGFYKSLAGRLANVIGYTDPSGFDSGNFDDTEDATDAGLMILQAETAGNKWIVDQTTYGFDSNFVYNSLQAMYMADVLSVQLADFLGKFIVGKSLADIGAAAIAGQIAKKMEEFRKLKIIGASDDAPLGYKGLDIQINGPIAAVKIECKLATAILFIPVQLSLSQIQSSASA